MDCECGRCENNADLRKQHNDYLNFERHIVWIVKYVIPLLLGAWLIVAIIGVVYFIFD